MIACNLLFVIKIYFDGYILYRTHVSKIGFLSVQIDSSSLFPCFCFHFEKADRCSQLPLFFFKYSKKKAFGKEKMIIIR